VSDRFGLQVQALRTGTQQVLVVGDLVASRSASRLFSPADVQQAFKELQVPAPSNISQALGKLHSSQFAMPHSRAVWSLTPLGRERVRELVGDASAKINSDGVASAEFARVEHTVIPPWAAPPRWQVGIRRLLEHHPFETNVFCMTRFPSEGPTPDPVTKAVEVLRNALGSFGLTVHLASDGPVDDDLLTNVGAYMWGSQYGIGIVEDRAASGLNYNAVIELGGMIVTGRRCAILKDTTVGELPTDLAGHVYREVDIGRPAKVAAEAEAWASKTLHLHKR
jgi:hypothetical protein